MSIIKQKRKPEDIEIPQFSNIDEINETDEHHQTNQDQPMHFLQSCQPYKFVVLILISLVLIGILIENAFIISISKSPQNYPINIADPKTTPPIPTTTPSPNPTTKPSITSPKPTTKPSSNENGLEHNLEGHGEEVAALAWLPNGLLASGAYDDQVYTWNVTSGERFVYLRGHTDAVSCLLSMPKHDLLVSGSFDRSLIAWDVTTTTNVDLDKRLKYRLDASNGGHRSGVYALAAINDDLFASASSDFTIKVWNVKSGELKFTFDSTNGGHTNYVLTLESFIIDGQYLLASGSLDKTVKLWDGLNGVLLHTFADHTARVSKLVYLGGNLLASGSDDLSVKIWDISVKSLKYDLTGHETPIVSMVRVGRTNLLATGVGVNFGPSYGEIKIWNFESGQLVHTFDAGNGCHTKSVDALVALSDDLLVSGSYDNTIKVWNVRSGSLVETFDRFNRGHRGPVTCLSRISEEKGLFASGSEDLLVKIWRFLL
jgi:WD40 repeat protein